MVVESHIVVEEGKFFKTMGEIGLMCNGELIEFLFEGEKETFNTSILPGTSWCGSLVFDTQKI